MKQNDRRQKEDEVIEMMRILSEHKETVSKTTQTSEKS